MVLSSQLMSYDLEYLSHVGMQQVAYFVLRTPLLDFFATFCCRTGKQGLSSELQPVFLLPNFTTSWFFSSPSIPLLSSLLTKYFYCDSVCIFIYCEKQVQYRNNKLCNVAFNPEFKSLSPQPWSLVLLKLEL